MLESLSIKNFRCFKEFKIDSLNKINLITGRNNAGKTALLEALFLLLGAKTAEIPTRLNLFRGVSTSLDADELWGWLFYNRDTKKQIEFECSAKGNNKHKVKISLGLASFLKHDAQNRNSDLQAVSDMFVTTASANNEIKIHYISPENKVSEVSAKINKNGIEVTHVPGELAFPFSIYLPSVIQQVITPQENAERFSKLEVMGKHEEIIESLKIIEPRLKRLMVSYTAGVARLVADLGFNPLIPVSYMGDGMNRLIAILLSIVTVQSGGCLLLDEIETGFHYSVMPQVWQVISHLAVKLDVQIIATSHSLEFIRAASQINEEDVFRLYRLERKESQIKAITYTKEAFDTSIEFGWEVR